MHQHLLDVHSGEALSQSRAEPIIGIGAHENDMSAYQDISSDTAATIVLLMMIRMPCGSRDTTRQTLLFSAHSARYHDG
jgi:hypothetical protein